MRIAEIIIGIILLGGAAWTVVKSYKVAAVRQFSFWRLPFFLFPRLVVRLWRLQCVVSRLQVPEPVDQVKQDW